MKIKSLAIIILIMTSTVGFSQRFKEVVLWQIETSAGGLLFGISESKNKAEITIKNFQKRNAGNKYDISSFEPIFKYTTLPVESRNENPVNKFKALAGKNYKVLSKEDLKSIDIAEVKGMRSAVSYYVKKRGSSWDFARKRIKDLKTKYDEFRIKDPERYLVYSK